MCRQWVPETQNEGKVLWLFNYLYPLTQVVQSSAASFTQHNAYIDTSLCWHSRSSWRHLGFLTSEPDARDTTKGTKAWTLALRPPQAPVLAPTVYSWCSLSGLHMSSRVSDQ